MSSATDRFVDELYGQLESLVAIGPRFHGTEAAEASADFVSERLQALGLEVTFQIVTCEGWALDRAAQLEVHEPEKSQLDCEAMLWSAPTPPDGVSGRLELVGNAGIWGGSYIWRKFALVDDGRPVAFICAREQGDAVPQPRPSGSAENIPHVVISARDGRQLETWLEGAHVLMNVTVPARRGGQAVGRNIMASLPGRDPTAQAVLICAHYDTFWNTPGAYDNGSGVVAVLELARQLRKNIPAMPIRLVFFTAEEWHLTGSQAFVRECPPAELEQIRYVLNIDGLGRGDLMEGSIGPELFEWTVHRAVKTYAEIQGRQLKVETRFPPMMGTDHAPFYEVGIPSAHLTFNDWPLLHHRDDVPNRESAANIAFTVGLLSYLIETLAPGPPRTQPFVLL